jgi:hypothetical protein
MYIDPNTGGILFQALAGVLAVFTGVLLLFQGISGSFFPDCAGTRTRMKKTSSGDDLSTVDWRRTKAYAVGLNSIYLNVAGREGQGNVPADEIENLLGGIRTKLSEWKDADGVPIIQKVHLKHETLYGPYTRFGPDLVVGYGGRRGTKRCGRAPERFGLPVMNKLFAVFNKKAQSKRKEPVIVVSGLPRSGTSMMMKILAEGGLPIVTDELRTAEMDNPNGYYELEMVKQMSAGNVAWLGDVGGKAVKVISSLLEYLPAQYMVKILFMEREIREILASQRKMLERRNEAPMVDDARMAEQFRKHLSIVKPWLARQPNMEVLYISYNALMSNPEPFCRRVNEFTCATLQMEQMLKVPNGELYRNRLGSG